MSTPTIEPGTIVAGDTITWIRSLADYPAPTWVLKYRLLNAAGKIDITAGASGSDHLVSVAAATSAAWASGDFTFTAWVESGAARHSVGQGRISISANLATVTTYDGRSPARKIYEGLLAAYEARVAGGQGYVAEYEIAGRRMKFIGASDWVNQLNYWKRQLAAEDSAARLAAGLPAGNRVLVRF